MSYHKSIGVSPSVHEYVINNCGDLHPELKALQDSTLSNPISKGVSGMCSPLDAAAFLQMMTRLTNAKKIVEVGVFTGFTTLSFALALPEDGVIHSLDISDEYASVGKPHWKNAGVDHKIDLIIGPALESMDTIHAKGEEVDIVFIDADKGNYSKYYNKAINMLRVGGLVIIDNTLWDGYVVDENDVSDSTIAIRETNKLVQNDDRVHNVMVTVSDGITIAMKK